MKDFGHRKLILNSEEDTRNLGHEIAEALEPGDVVALIGDLGTGKTALTKYIAEGLGITEEINSPTFTIVKEYRSGRLPLYHFDVYRLGSGEELLDIGAEEMLEGDGVCVIEWADIVADVLPDMQQPHLLLYLLFNIAVNVLPFYFHDIRRARRLDQQVDLADTPPARSVLAYAPERRGGFYCRSTDPEMRIQLHGIVHYEILERQTHDRVPLGERGQCRKPIRPTLDLRLSRLDEFEIEPRIIVAQPVSGHT